jgi:hypothetical protein
VKGKAVFGTGQEASATVYRWRSGFQHSFEYVLAQYPQGVDPRDAVWMWNRLLEQLAAVHQLGYIHGNLKPAHLLVHPRDHGLMLCGWSTVQKGADPGLDVAAGARCIEAILGKGKVPKLFSELVRWAGLPGRVRQARALQQELKRVAQGCFGPPQFHPFILK